MPVMCGVAKLLPVQRRLEPCSQATSMSTPRALDGPIGLVGAGYIGRGERSTPPDPPDYPPPSTVNGALPADWYWSASR